MNGAGSRLPRRAELLDSVLRELERKLELQQSTKQAAPSAVDANSVALVSSLQNAFRHENAILQEIQQMSEGLRSQGF